MRYENIFEILINFWKSLRPLFQITSDMKISYNWTTRSLISVYRGNSFSRASFFLIFLSVSNFQIS